MKITPYRIFISIFIIFICISIRLALPTFLVNYTNNKINQLPDYQGQIADMDLNIWRGSLAIKNLLLQKREISSPFLSVGKIIIAVQWSALLHGELVVEINIINPAISIMMDKAGKTEALDSSTDWQNRIKDFYHFSINKITIARGELHFINRKGEAPFEIRINNISAEITNITNIKQEEHTLFAKLNARAETEDGAPITLRLDFDPLASQLAFNLDAEVKKMNLVTISPLIKREANLIIKKGYFSLFIEAAVANNRIKGYVKPFIQALQIDSPAEQKQNPVQKLYKTAVEGISKLVENPEQKTVATKVPLIGTIDDPNASLWATVINILRHGFISALLPQLDHSIEFKQVNINAK